MLTLDQVKQMEQTGQWQAIRDQVPSYLEVADQSEHARLHLSLATAIFRTASGAGDLRSALDHARLAHDKALPTSIVKANAMEKVASLLVSLGRPHAAARYANAYLGAATAFPQLAPLTPYVIRTLSHIHYQTRHFKQAIALRYEAIQGFTVTGDAIEVLRTRLNLAWAYYRLGMVRQAREALPDSVPAELIPLLNGAKAAVCALEGDWVAAKAFGLLAISGSRDVFDLADAAEVCMVVAEAARRLESRSQAAAYLIKAAEFASLQGRDIRTLLLLSQREKGGVLTYVHAACAVGSGGVHLGSWYTTGVA